MSDTANDESVVISNYTKKRLIHDIKDIYKNPLTENGIYYIHDDTNMLKGYAMIIGPEDSVYEHGFYFFEFHFPSIYPQIPPKVIFKTGDGLTRFHPNLYISGKVCLSILNTWHGEQWTSCQSIKTILLTLVSILDNKPLLHEPHISEQHRDFKNYNRIIKYKNISTGLYKQYKHHDSHIISQMFFPMMKEYVSNNKEKILEYIKKLSNEENEDKRITTNIYNCSCVIKYKHLFEVLKKML